MICYGYTNNRDEVFMKVAEKLKANFSDINFFHYCYLNIFFCKIRMTKKL